jgi:hypothetical protein
MGGANGGAEMTIDKLIQKLEDARLLIGGACEVKVVGTKGVPTITLSSETIDDPTSETGAGAVLWLKATGEPE